MANEKVTLEIVTKSSASGTAQDGSPLASKGSNGAGGIAVLIGKLAVIGKVVTDLFWAFKPVITIIGQLFKMLGLFLQPVAEVLVYIIKPFIELLRPLALIFKTIMTPFIDLIKRASVLASMQAGAGDLGGLLQTSGFMLEVLFRPIVAVLKSAILGGGSLDPMSGDDFVFADSVDRMWDPVTGKRMADRYGVDMSKPLISLLDSNIVSLSRAASDLYDKGISNPLISTLNNIYVDVSGKLLIMENSFSLGLQTAVVDPVKNAVDKLIEEKKRLDAYFGKSKSTGTYNKSVIFTDPTNIYNKSNQSVRDISGYYTSNGMPFATSILTSLGR